MLLLLIPTSLAIPTTLLPPTTGPVYEVVWREPLSMEVVVEGVRVEVLLTPHPSVACLHSGVVDGSPGSLAAVAGCRGGDTTITLAAATLPAGIVDLVTVDGVTRVVGEQGERRRREVLEEEEEGEEDFPDSEGAADEDYEYDYGLEVEPLLLLLLLPP